ncbi:putative translocation protein TolR [Thauera sp. 28]|uniref:ExbD/TolR family protein n=1 Tax=Thauera sp. 28 TaxID=303682 RepID=UPI0002CEAF9E|nr:ExbD/TolR family protein [Thauera sp. 28]ENO93827.1 putative translocation protein TolR [Thauera sp. 28]
MRQRRLMNQINVVPYIDVMLVLLVIFMVTAPMVQTGNINVPSAGPAEAPVTEAIVIQVDDKGAYSIIRRTGAQPESISKERLSTMLKDFVTENPEQPFLLAAHRDLNYQQVIDVLETARKQGVRKISLQTQSSTSGR